MLRRCARLAACCGLIVCGSCINAILAANRARELTAVETRIRDFNASLTRGDTVAMRMLVRANYRLIEDSVEYDLASAVTAVATAHSAGTMTRELADVRIEQRGAFAWATYHVRAQFISGHDTLRFGRKESVVLEHINSQWTIAFMTSAPTTPDH
jgi:hypothetical protein